MNRKHNGKTFKKPYRKSRVFDKTCRSHGGCPACYANRMYSTWKRIANAEDTKEEEACLAACERAERKEDTE